MGCHMLKQQTLVIMDFQYSGGICRHQPPSPVASNSLSVGHHFVHFASLFPLPSLFPVVLSTLLLALPLPPPSHALSPRLLFPPPPPPRQWLQGRRRGSRQSDGWEWREPHRDSSGSLKKASPAGVYNLSLVKRVTKDSLVQTRGVGA